MALVKFGAGVSEMRGKEGGVIYSKNAYGSYMKTKVSPTNPQTKYQQDVRAVLQGIASSWKDLTQTQKDNWKDLGAQVERVNRFGDITNFTGFTLFMKLNLNIITVGGSAITAAPSVPTIPTLVAGDFIAESTVESLSLAFTPSLTSSGISLVSYVTPLIYTGKNFVKNIRRFIQADSEPTTAVDMLTAWKVRFGAMVTGARVMGAWKLVDEATGFEGSLVVKTTTVTVGS